MKVNWKACVRKAKFLRKRNYAVTKVKLTAHRWTTRHVLGACSQVQLFNKLLEPYGVVYNKNNTGTEIILRALR